MKLVTMLKIAKPIVSMVAGLTTSVVVGQVIGMNTPANLSKIQDLSVKVGTFFIGGVVGTFVSDSVEKTFDQTIGAVEEAVAVAESFKNELAAEIAANDALLKKEQ